MPYVPTRFTWLNPFGVNDDESSVLINCNMLWLTYYGNDGVKS